MIFDIALILLGLVLLISGGESLVRGASALALKLGLSPLVIGLVVVSSATSAPEFAVTIGSVVRGEPDLAVGNVVGSNIVNILLILGIAALVAPLSIKRQLLRFDMPVMLLMSVAIFLVSLDGKVELMDGALLFGALVFHTILSLKIGKNDSLGISEETLPLNSAPEPIWRSVLFLVLGVGLLIAGSQALVTGAVQIATALGVSSLVIGLTVVAIGTSLPELATSIVAIRKGETDMAVGNVVGSNIFNIGMVLGLPAMIFGAGIPVAPSLLAIDIPFMIAATVALVPIAFTGFKIARWEGALFTIMFTLYTLYLVLDSTNHDATVGFSQVMVWLVAPLIAATLIAITAYEVGLIQGSKRGNSKSP